MSLVVLDIQVEITQAILGKPCWYASCGGAAGSTFQLAFGKRVPRQYVLRNEKHSDEYRNFEAESNLLVWCSWRLDHCSGPISSSDDTNEHISEALTQLVGSAATDVKIDMPGWDLQIGFSSGSTLRVFCDHVPGDPSFDGNWELWEKDRVISIGVGSICEVEPRTA